MNEPIRILYLVDSLSHTDDDTVHLRRLIGHLDPGVFDVSVLVTGDMPCDPEFARLLCPVGQLGMSGRGTVNNIWARWRLRRILQRNHFDIVCASGFRSRALGLPAAKSARVPVRLASIRDMGQYLEPHDLVILRQANLMAARFVTTTSATAVRLMRQEKVSRDVIDIIPAGVDAQDRCEHSSTTVADAKHRFGLSVHQPVVVMEAPFERFQDHPTFLAAAAHLRPLHPQARFVLLGAGSQSSIAQVKEEADRLGIADLLLFVDDSSLYDLWLRAADVAVLTAIFEGCSNTLLTYMAAGVPVVAADAGGNSELITHGQSGYLFPPMEADALAVRIHLLLTAGDVALGLAASARQRVRTEFTAEKEARRFSDYYRSLVYSSDRWSPS